LRGRNRGRAFPFDIPPICCKTLLATAAYGSRARNVADPSLIQTGFLRQRGRVETRRSWRDRHNDDAARSVGRRWLDDSIRGEREQVRKAD
jgi:hypothetical protein